VRKIKSEIVVEKIRSEIFVGKNKVRKNKK